MSKLVSMVAAAARIAVNPKIATGEEVGRRLAVCATCQLKVTKTKRDGAQFEVCGAMTCGCPLASIAKFAATPCPKSKW